MGLIAEHFLRPRSAQFYEELHTECLASTPPQALEFNLAPSNPGLSLYLYPETAYRGAPSGHSDSC